MMTLMRSVRKSTALRSTTPQGQVQKLYRQILGSRVKLVDPKGRSQELPGSLRAFLLELTAGLRTGRSVAIVQDEAQCTTMEGARLLGVSRQFLVRMLERGEIPHHKVGTHRRIYLRDVLAYKGKRDSKRCQILNHLTKAEAADGLYDLEPVDVAAG